MCGFRFFDFGMMMKCCVFSSELKGMFLHMIDGCRSRNEKGRGCEGGIEKNEGGASTGQKNASMGEVQNRIFIW